MFHAICFTLIVGRFALKSNHLTGDCKVIAPGFHGGCPRISRGLPPDFTGVAPGLHGGCPRTARVSGRLD